VAVTTLIGYLKVARHPNLAKDVAWPLPYHMSGMGVVHHPIVYVDGFGHSHLVTWEWLRQPSKVMEMACLLRGWLGHSYSEATHMRPAWVWRITPMAHGVASVISPSFFFLFFFMNILGKVAPKNCNWVDFHQRRPT